MICNKNFETLSFREAENLIQIHNNALHVNLEGFYAFVIGGKHLVASELTDDFASNTGIEDYIKMAIVGLEQTVAPSANRTSILPIEAIKVER